MGAMAIPLGLTAAAGIVGAYGSYKSAQAQQEAAKYSAGVDSTNAAMADREAADALQRGAVEEGRARIRTRQLAGTQKAALAATGVDPTYGSAAGILSDTASLGELDAMTIAENAKREAYQARVGAMGYRSQADLAKTTADSISPGLEAGTSLLSSGAQFSDRWYTMNYYDPNRRGR
jgi:hypothetical protein